jgi:hypothetical protein
MLENDSYSFDANAVRNFFRREKDKGEGDKIYDDEKGLRILLNQKEGDKEENIPSESRYLVETNRKDEIFKYFGYLNEEAQRSSFGCQVFNADSSFLGTWKNDEMIHGIYFYSPSEIFAGEFNKGQKVKGIYFWNHQEDKFDAFIGDFSEDKVHQGLHYSRHYLNPQEKIPLEKISEEKIPEEKIPLEKISEEKIPEEKIPLEKISEEKIPQEKIPKEEIPEEHVYLGKFVEGQRNDENGLYFLHHKNILFQGNIIGEKLVRGVFKKGNDENSQDSEVFQIKRNKEDLPFTESAKDSDIQTISHNYELLTKINLRDILTDLYKKCRAMRGQFLSIKDFQTMREGENFVYFSEIYKTVKDIESNIK